MKLSDLPTGAIIRTEISEYEGTYELTNLESCCSGWHTFTIFDGQIEIVDDFTPEGPWIAVYRSDGCILVDHIEVKPEIHTAYGAPSVRRLTQLVETSDGQYKEDAQMALSYRQSPFWKIKPPVTQP